MQIKTKKRKPEEIAKLISKVQKLSKEMSLNEIARKLSLPYSETFVYSKGFSSQPEYKRHLAEKKGLQSQSMINTLI